MSISEIGISTTEAIRLFLKQVELCNSLPFPVSVPNQETTVAMMEANNPAGLKRYQAFSEFAQQGVMAFSLLTTTAFDKDLKEVERQGRTFPLSSPC